MKKSLVKPLLGVAVAVFIPLGGLVSLGVTPAGASQTTTITAFFKFHSTGVTGGSTCNPSTKPHVTFNSSTQNAAKVTYTMCATSTTGTLITTPAPGNMNTSTATLSFGAGTLTLETSGVKISVAASGAKFTITRTGTTCTVTISKALSLTRTTSTHKTYTSGSVDVTGFVNVTHTTASHGFCHAVYKTLNHPTANVTMKFKVGAVLT